VIDTFSYSAIATFNNCPMAFRFRYLEKRPEAFVTVETHMGRVMHGVLFQAYAATDGPASVPAAVLEAKYRELWEQADLQRLHIVRQEVSLHEYFQAGHDMLLAYQRRVMGNDRRFSLGLEKNFQLHLSPDIAFRGVVDRIARQENGCLRVIDYKTGRTGDPFDSLQLPAYALFALTLTTDEAVELCFEDLREQVTKTTLFFRAQADNTKQQLVEAIDVIRQAKEFPPRPSALCRWCGYSPDCPAVAGPSLAVGVSEPAGDLCDSCPECGAPLVRRKGRYGEFLGCTAFPGCRFTLDLSVNEAQMPAEMVCPECGSPLRERKGRYGRFLGCSRYPACRFSRDVSTKDKKA